MVSKEKPDQPEIPPSHYGAPRDPKTLGEDLLNFLDAPEEVDPSMPLVSGQEDPLEQLRELLAAKARGEEVDTEKVNALRRIAFGKRPDDQQ